MSFNDELSVVQIFQSPRGAFTLCSVTCSGSPSVELRVTALSKTMAMALAPSGRLRHGLGLEVHVGEATFVNGGGLRGRCTPSRGQARPGTILRISNLFGGGKKSDDVESADEQKKKVWQLVMCSMHRGASVVLA